MKTKHRKNTKTSHLITIVSTLGVAVSTTIAATIDTDGFSTDPSNSVPEASRSAAIGWSNSTSNGGHGYGQPGNNLLGGSGNQALICDATFTSGLYNILTYQEGSIAFGWENSATATQGLPGQANIILGYSNTVTTPPNTSIWGNVLIGAEHQSSVQDAWLIGRGHIGQIDTVILGTYAQTQPNAALIVGRGTSPSSRDNGLVVYKDGRISIPGNISLGSTSGIYFGSNTTATLKANANGAAIFPAQTNFQGGIVLSGGQLSISDATASASSSTGAFTTSGGIGVAKDSWFNGVRIGKGNNNVSTNTAVGSLALNAISTGLNNTALGSSSLSINTTGSSNTGLGTNALAVNTTGGGNTAVGSRSLIANSTGTGNTAVGTSALQANTSGGSNSSLGLAAQYYNTTGSYNTALARMSLYFNSTGEYNIAIGYGAGRFHADGATPLTDPESCIYIGANSRGKDNNDANSIVIGTGAIGDGANTTVIGTSNTVKTRIFGAIDTSSITLSGPSGSGGEALVVEGHTRLKGQVIIEQPQGDISMGIYGDPSTGGL